MILRAEKPAPIDFQIEPHQWRAIGVLAAHGGWQFVPTLPPAAVADDLTVWRGGYCSELLGSRIPATAAKGLGEALAREADALAADPAAVLSLPMSEDARFVAGLPERDRILMGPTVPVVHVGDWLQVDGVQLRRLADFLRGAGEVRLFAARQGMIGLNATWSGAGYQLTGFDGPAPDVRQPEMRVRMLRSCAAPDGAGAEVHCAAGTIVTVVRSAGEALIRERAATDAEAEGADAALVETLVGAAKTGLLEKIMSKVGTRLSQRGR
jgi:hypothetical protein